MSNFSNRQEKPALYRSGPISGIKVFHPREFGKRHDQSFKNRPLIYASSDINYAAGFCFDWSDNEGFKFGKSNKGPWTLQIPKQFRYKLLNKCSLYKVVNTDFFPVPKVTVPEYYTVESCKVLEETVFNTCLICLKTYNIKLVFI